MDTKPRPDLGPKAVEGPPTTPRRSAGLQPARGRPQWLSVLVVWALMGMAIGCGEDDPQAGPSPTQGDPAPETMTTRVGMVSPPDDPGMAGAGGNQAQDGANAPPVASFTAEPQCVEDLQSNVTLTSTSTDADGDALTCEFTMSAGIPPSSSSCSVDVRFSIAAPQPVQLTVRDGRGGMDTATMDLAPCPGFP